MCSLLDKPFGSVLCCVSKTLRSNVEFILSIPWRLFGMTKMAMDLERMMKEDFLYEYED